MQELTNKERKWLVGLVSHFILELKVSEDYPDEQEKLDHIEKWKTILNKLEGDADDN